MRRPNSTLRGLPLLALLVPISTVGCADGSGLETTVEPDPPTSPAQAVIDDWLDLDLEGPPSYAEHAWPLHYIPSIVVDNNVPEHNPTTDRGATLGRVLFYDRQLSFDGSISCASCHHQALGFTDSLPRSVGIDGGRTRLRSMRLGNAMFYFGRDMFWDRRVPSVEAQVVLPILDRFEMGFTSERGGFEALRARMESLPYYPILFEWVFGTPDIDRDRIERALAQFVRSLISTDSDFDRAVEEHFRETGVLRPADLPDDFSDEVRRGYRLFMTAPEDGGAGCVSCHRFPAFQLDANSFNNGVDPTVNHLFKAPSLKNVALTGPYMHDGRFATLREVLDHYAEGIRGSTLLDRRLQRPDGTFGIPMTPSERDAIVAFLGTLTDETLLADPKFGDPFLR